MANPTKSADPHAKADHIPAGTDDKDRAGKAKLSGSQNNGTGKPGKDKPSSADHNGGKQKQARTR
jgi:hypothetical protein